MDSPLHMPTQQQALSRLPSDALWVLQITDTHLYADENTTLLGINTLDSLKQVLAYALDVAPRTPDLILATGDLVHDASEQGYRTFAKTTLATGLPVHCLPGNHDNPETMKRVLQPMGVGVSDYFETDHWQMFFLDSTVPGEEGGAISMSDLAAMQRKLTHNPKYAMLCMHHHPMPVDSAWIDGMSIENGQDIMQLAQTNPQVRGITFGHVHQALDIQHGHTRILACPSTCFQFTPGISDFGLSNDPPGCRIITLSPDGSINSATLGLAENVPALNLNAGGYQ